MNPSKQATTLAHLCAAPLAGRALLAAHWWIRRNAVADASPMDLLGTLAGLPMTPEERVETLEILINEQEERGKAMFSLFHAMLQLERYEALALSLGHSTALPPHLAQPFKEQLRRISGEEPGSADDAKGGAQ